MKKIPLNKLDLDLYHVTLPSGLEVYIVKKDKVNNASVKLTTKYGGNTIEFVPYGKNKMKKYPLGIAHFLEHQMFNMEDGSNPMAVFEGTGASSNAFTNYYQTTYLFDGMHNILDNISYLLHFVAKPYFTLESVEKEKGIIVSEAKMYLNYPDTLLDDTMMKNTFKVYPSKYPVIGLEKEILKTTKEDLYDCYNTFYHPSNMFLTIVGNVNPNEIIEVVKKSELNTKHLHDKPRNLKIKSYDEPTKVVKEYEEINCDVVIPKIVLNYKLSVKQFTMEERIKLYLYLLILLDSKLGSSSLFLDELRTEEIITETVQYEVDMFDNYFIIPIYASTKYYDELLNRLKHEMINLDISEEEFKRKQKVLISGYIYSSDNIYSISSKITSDIIRYGSVITDYYGLLKSLNYYEMKSMLQKISFKNKNIVIARKK